MIAVTQPSYLYEMGEQYIERIGDRAVRLMPLRSMLDAGIRVVISSDSDVASYRPLDTIAAAMTRTSVTGRSMGSEQSYPLMKRCVRTRSTQPMQLVERQILVW